MNREYNMVNAEDIKPVVNRRFKMPKFASSGYSDEYFCYFLHQCV